MTTDPPLSIDWSQHSIPLSIRSFENYIQQSIFPPIQMLGIDEYFWEQCRSFALNLFEQGLIDPIALVYTWFKQIYSSDISYRTFVRWFSADPWNEKHFPVRNQLYPVFQSSSELANAVKILPPSNLDEIDRFHDFKQIWLFNAISIRVPLHENSIQPEVAVLDQSIARNVSHVKKGQAIRVYCLFAVTPSGKYSNQLYVYRTGRHIKVTPASNRFTRIEQTSNGHLSPEHLDKWLEDFLSFHSNENSALLIDPRTTLISREFQRLSENSKLRLITIDLNCYLTHILNPIFSTFDKRWTEANFIEKMQLKSISNLQRTIDSTYFSLRTLIRDNQIQGFFQGTKLWKENDEKYFQSLQLPVNHSIIKIKKKKSHSGKTGMKSKVLPMMIEPAADATAEEIFSLLLHRQTSIARASKFLGGAKLDYFKYCLTYKTVLTSITGEHLVKLNEFLQSKSTVNWLKQLRKLHFWPCAQQLFLREIYQMTGFILRKRTRQMCGPNQLGSLRTCDQQSPPSFWKVFEQIHSIQFDREPMPNEKHWKTDFQNYLSNNQLDPTKVKDLIPSVSLTENLKRVVVFCQASLWTLDVFEFPLTKNSTILQLPEWNELRPMNSTAKVSILFAFSQDGQFTEPHFVFPRSLRIEDSTEDISNSYNDLGHLTPAVFQSWIKTHLTKKNSTPMILLFCSRLPILSPSVFNCLKENQIYPFGFPFARTLPFRYLFERRVRNNRSTNLISELWKRTLLNEQRTHVLRGIHCSVKTIKGFFQQIWPFLLTEKRDDDEEQLEFDSSNLFKEKCRQAFEQANIRIESNSISEKADDLIEQLQQLAMAIDQLRQFVQSNKSELSKLPTSIDDVQLMETTNADEFSMTTDQTLPINSTRNSTITTDKRFHDETDEPRAFKRLRSSSSFCRSIDTISFSNQWIPPSNQQIHRLHSQTSSVFQFLLLLIDKIFNSSTYRLTDEQSRWLHSIVNLYDQSNDADKLNFLIETASRVIQTNQVR